MEIIVSIRKLCLCLLILTLTACTSVFSDVRATFDYALSSPEDAHLSPNEIESFPYTAVYANWEDMARALVVLGYIEGDEYHWITADRETLVTSHGRVVRTALLERDILGITNLAADPLHCILRAERRTECPTDWERAIEYTDLSGIQQGRIVRSKFSIDTTESLELPAQTVNVTRVTERGAFWVGDKAVKHFENIFWLQADGHVVKSQQTLAPDFPVLVLTQVKWVGRDE